LVQTIADVYSFAEDIESLSEKIMRFEKIISALVKQTEECALFIREYTGHGFCGRYIRNRTFVSLIKFTGRLLTNIDSEYSDKIEHFVTAFVKLGEYLDRGTAVQIMFVSTKALTVVEEVGEWISLALGLRNVHVRPQSEPRSLITLGRST
jgi:hypothetical protein